MIGYSIRLAIMEYGRGTGWFGLGRLFGMRRAPGGRDFVALTFLCAIIIALVAFAHGAGRGVAENITQVMLGHIRGAGTPIWVVANFRRNDLDAAALAVFRNGGGWPADPASATAPPEPSAPSILRQLDFFPVVETEPNDALVQLPSALARRTGAVTEITDAPAEAKPAAATELPVADGPPAVAAASPAAAWRPAALTGDAPVPFRGWIVDAANPVLAAFGGNAGDDRTVVLNRKLFETHFDYAAYRSVLEQALPKSLSDTLPASLADITALDTIYLSLPFDGWRRRLVPFKVVWANTLPGLQKISMLVPLPAMSLARLAQYGNPQVDLVFEDDRDNRGAPFRILTGLTFLGTDHNQPAAGGSLKDAFSAFDACLGPTARRQDQVNSTSYDFTRSPFVVPWPAVEDCLKRAGLDGYRSLSYGFDSGQAVKASGRMVEAPCEAVPPAIRAKTPACGSKDGRALFAPFSTFRSGLVFVPSHGDVGTTVDGVRQYSDKRGLMFLLGENYEDALGRMDYTQKVISYLTLALGGLGIALCAAVLILQIRPLLQARLPVLGLLLARGIRARAIYAGIAAQMILTVAVATLFAMVLLAVIRFGVEWAFGQSDAAQKARLDFGLSDPRLIPLQAGAHGEPLPWLVSALPSLSLAVALTAVFVLVFAMMTLRLLPLSGTTTPIEMILDRGRAPARADAGAKPR